MKKFDGPATKVILAAQPVACVRKIYETHKSEAAEAGMGRDWTELRATLAAIRKRGYQISHGEVVAALSGIGAPIPAHASEPAAALALVATRERFTLFNESVLIKLIRKAVEEIAVRLAEHARPDARRP